MAEIMEVVKFEIKDHITMAPVSHLNYSRWVNGMSRYVDAMCFEIWGTFVRTGNFPFQLFE